MESLVSYTLRILFQGRGSGADMSRALTTAYGRWLDAFDKVITYRTDTVGKLVRAELVADFTRTNLSIGEVIEAIKALRRTLDAQIAFEVRIDSADISISSKGCKKSDITKLLATIQAMLGQVNSSEQAPHIT